MWLAGNVTVKFNVMSSHLRHATPRHSGGRADRKGSVAQTSRARCGPRREEAWRRREGTVVAGTGRGRRVGGRERHQDRALPRRRRAHLPPPVLGLHPRVYSRSTFCKSAVLKPYWSFPKRLLSVLPTPDAGPGVSPGVGHVVVSEAASQQEPRHVCVEREAPRHRWLRLGLPCRRQRPTGRGSSPSSRSPLRHSRHSRGRL